MCSGSGTDEARCQIEQVQQKLIGLLERDTVFPEFLVGKIREIVGDNRVRSPVNGRRQNMPIIRVSQHRVAPFTHAEAQQNLPVCGNARLHA